MSRRRDPVPRHARRERTFATVVAVSCAALALMLGWQARAVAGLRTERAAMAATLAAETAKLADVERRIASTETPGPGDGSPAVAKRERSPAEIREHLMRDPAYRAYELRRTRLELLLRYGPSLERLALPPATAARLKDLLVARELAEQEARGASRKPGTPVHDRFAAEFEALLGIERAALLRRIEAALPYRSTAARFEVALADEGAPLSAAQRDALADALAAAAPRERDPAAEYAQAVVAAVGEVLSPPQRERVREWLERQRRARDWDADVPP